MKINIPDTKLYRDLNSKALLNTDIKGRDEYLMKREIAKKQQQKEINLENRMSNIEKDMMEIKNLLNEIIRKV